MPVMNIRKMCMLVSEFLMLVDMRVWLHSIPVEVMGVLMVFIMAVSMSMQ